MSMKKHNKIVAIGLSCALAFSLAACGGDDKPSNNNAPNPDNIKTEQVTEAQWKTALDFSQVTNATLKVTERMTMAGVTEETYDLYKFDGNKVYNEEKGYDYDGSENATPVLVTVKEYYSKDGENNYIYTYDEQTKKWSKEESYWFPTPNDYYGSLVKITNAYDKFTYNAAKGAYIAADADWFVEDESYDSISVKIVDGKLSVVQMDMSEDMGVATATMSFIFQIYDYGTTSVTLPKVGGSNTGEIIGGSSTEVDEALWNAALSSNAFGNVSIVMTDSRYGEEYDAEFKIDLARQSVYQSSYGGNPDGTGNVKHERIVAFLNGDYRLIERIDGEDWRYVGLSSDSVVDIAANVTMALSVFDYSSFTYDSASEQYIAHNFSAPDMGIQEVDVEMKFNRGKLQYVNIIIEIEGKKESQRMTFSNYGTTLIDIPSVDMTENPSGGMDEKEWYAAFDRENFMNCTMTEINQGYGNGLDGKPSTIKMDYKNGMLYMSSYGAQDEAGNEVHYYETVIADGYTYAKEDNEDWQKYDGDMIELDTFFNEFYLMFAMFIDDYNLFTYDEISNSYVATNYVMNIDSDYSYTADRVSLRFVDGKLVESVIERTKEKQTIITTIIIENYNNTVVDVPKIA